MITQKVVYIKRKIKVDNYLQNFIFFNINYRRKIWNLFVNEYYNCNESWTEFNPSNFSSKLINSIDNDVKETNQYYCTDIIKSVYCDIKTSMQQIKFKTINDKNHHSLKFKRFDRYKGSFKVRTANIMSKTKKSLQGKVHIQNNLNFIFRAWRKNHFNITLCEPIYDQKIDDIYCFFNKDKSLKCYFRDEDIKQIVFSHELGQFYISLSINITYIIDDEEINNRKNIAGIDLGIHNPITLYDGTKIMNIRMSNKELNKIHYLERRCKRLQIIMNRKMEINLQRQQIDPNYNIYTNKYNEVRRKFRRSWKRIQDIRCNWRRKIAKYICTNYKVIVVDKFKQPTKDEHKCLPNKISKYLNHFNREHAMYLFTQLLIHDCIKFGCEFINAPKKTTRICNCCKHLNPKLPLSQRIFKCEKCGYSIDRDINASVNCYDYYTELL